MGALIDTTAKGQLQDLEAELELAHPMPSVRLAARAAGLITLASVGGLLLWACISPLERAVIAPGNLIAEGRRKTITLLESAVVRTMLVKDGDKVTRGQVLFRLDTTQAQATADQAKSQYWGGLARIARLQAEQLDQRTLEIPKEIDEAALTTPTLRELIDTERRLFPARWEAYDGNVAVQTAAIAALKAQVSGIPRQRAAVERQRTAIRERIRGFSDLARTGVGSRFQVLELIEPEQGYNATIEQLTAQEAQLQQAIAQGEATLATLRLNRQQDIANDMQTTSAMVAQARQALLAAEEVLSRRDVVAPEDGTITNIQLYTPGSSIQAGQAVMDLIPSNDRMIVEAHVQPIDIEQVIAGQRSNVRLMSYRTRQLPILRGRVLTVAPDQQTDGPSGLPYFMARLELNDEDVASLPGIVLTAGMPTESYIIGDARTVASYLISPLVDVMHRSMRD